MRVRFILEHYLMLFELPVRLLLVHISPSFYICTFNQCANCSPVSSYQSHAKGIKLFFLLFLQLVIRSTHIVIHVYGEKINGKRINMLKKVNMSVEIMLFRCFSFVCTHNLLKLKSKLFQSHTNTSAK